MRNLLPILFLAIGCGQHVKDATMFFYGDSITAGSNQPASQPSYPQLISIGFGIDNEAKGGTSMFHPNSWGETPIYSQVMAGQWRAKDTVFILPGANDCIYYGTDPTNLAIYAQAMSDIVQKALASPVGLVYIATTLKIIEETAVTTRFFPDSCGQTYADLNAQSVVNANSSKIKLLDLRSCFQPNWSNTVDGLHPNKQGYAEIFACYQNLK